MRRTYTHVVVTLLTCFTLHSPSYIVSSRSSEHEEQFDHSIGCEVEDVCNDYEYCLQDGAFGQCVSEAQRMPLRYLSDEEKISVGVLIGVLQENGLSLSNLYSQCILHAAYIELQADGSGELFNICGDLPPPRFSSVPAISLTGFSQLKRQKIRQGDTRTKDAVKRWGVSKEFEFPSVYSSLNRDSSNNLEIHEKQLQRYFNSFMRPDNLRRRQWTDKVFGQTPEKKLINEAKNEDVAKRARKSGTQKIEQTNFGFIFGVILVACVLSVMLTTVTAFGLKSIVNMRGSVKKIDDEALIGTEEKEGSARKQLEPLPEESKGMIAYLRDVFSPHRADNNTLSSKTQKPTLNGTGQSGAKRTESLSSQRTSTSSWSGEPIKMDIDITTGHLILSYLEKHLKNRDQLDAEWSELSRYEADDSVVCEAADRETNVLKNRHNCPVPYEQSRVKLRKNAKNDYINASLIYDDEPRNPAYIAAQTPMHSTVADFWQMIWDQATVIIINLDRPGQLRKNTLQNGLGNKHTTEYKQGDEAVQYWPTQGSEQYGQFEVHLVSEHHCGPEFVVRSFYLKSLDDKETKTVTQFHFIAWTPEKSLQAAVKPMLDFRRKVNKSFRAKSSPILVHCEDGSGLTGMYLLLDLALNRIVRGLKELDIGASLEHLRDQRQGMVSTREQYEFVLTAIAEEVNSLLNSATA